MINGKKILFRDIIPIGTVTTISAAPLAVVAIVESTHNQPTIIPESITLDQQTLSIETGQSSTLTGHVGPKGASQNVEGETSNPNAATIDNDGTVHGVGDGTAVISVGPEGYKETVTPATCTVTVTTVYVPQSISITEGTSASVNYYYSEIMRHSTVLHAKVEPAQASQQVEGTSLNPTIMTIDPQYGDIDLLVDTGTATIQVHPVGYDNIKANIQVSINKDRLTFNYLGGEDIGNACNKFEDDKDVTFFCQMFKVLDLESADPDDTKDVTQLSDFVGQSVELLYDNLGGSTAKVIGVQQDFMTYNSATGALSNPSTFTFEAQSLIPFEKGTSYGWVGNDSEEVRNKSFGTSPIWLETLNKSLLTILPDAVRVAKPTYRFANVYNDTKQQGEPKVSTVQSHVMPARFFLPTLSDIFSPAGIDSPQTDPNIYLQENVRYIASRTDTQYLYYQQTIGDNPCGTGEFPYSALFHDPRFCSYPYTNCYSGIASPYINEEQVGGQDEFYYAGALGGIPDYDVKEQAMTFKDVTQQAYIAPCFCV